jgi:hypothetical protein
VTPKKDSPADFVRVLVSTVLILTMPTAIFAHVLGRPLVSPWYLVPCLVVGAIGIMWKQIIAVLDDKSISVDKGGLKIEDKHDG